MPGYRRIRQEKRSRASGKGERDWGENAFALLLEVSTVNWEGVESVIFDQFYGIPKITTVTKQTSILKRVMAVYAKTYFVFTVMITLGALLRRCNKNT